jgi:transposase-like protein
MADILGLANSKKSIAMESEYKQGSSRNFGVSDKSVRRYLNSYFSIENGLTKYLKRCLKY